jgi:hypothetical protein
MPYPVLEGHALMELTAITPGSPGLQAALGAWLNRILG